MAWRSAWRITGSPLRPIRRCIMPPGRVALALAPIDDAPGQHQPVGRGVDEQRVRMAEMPRPIAAADGAGDQPVGGGGVGNAQQRLGEAEQQHAFAARQPIFMQEGIDAASLVPPCPRREHEPFGEPRDLALLLLAASRACSIRAATSWSSSASSASRKPARRGKDRFSPILSFGSPMEESLILEPSSSYLDRHHSGSPRNPLLDLLKINSPADVRWLPRSQLSERSRT